jgi:hypothetical protein
VEPSKRRYAQAVHHRSGFSVFVSVSSGLITGTVDAINGTVDTITGTVDMLIAYGSVKGYVESDEGCSELPHLVERLAPRVVVGERIRVAHGVQVRGAMGLDGTTLMNAATARDSHILMG